MSMIILWSCVKGSMVLLTPSLRSLGIREKVTAATEVIEGQIKSMGAIERNLCQSVYSGFYILTSPSQVFKAHWVFSPAFFI